MWSFHSGSTEWMLRTGRLYITFYRNLFDWDSWYVYLSFILHLTSTLKQLIRSKIFYICFSDNSDATLIQSNYDKYASSFMNNIQHCNCRKQPIVFSDCLDPSASHEIGRQATATLETQLS